MGLDRKFLATWARLYSHFDRHICLGPYIDPTPLENLNGISQGDCASVLAVNILMAAWSSMIQQFWQVTSWVFIDDVYFYAKVEHIDQLPLAVRAAELFDTLVGQQLNLSESCGWATTKEAQKNIAEKLPQIPISEFFAVLGTSVKTGRKARVIHDPASSNCQKLGW